MKVFNRVILDLSIITAVNLGAITIPCLAESAPESPYRVGRFWEYSHVGPRPGGDPIAIDGQRILCVIESIGSGAEQRRVVEERYTHDPNVVSRLHLLDDRTMTAVVLENEKGESLTLTYDKPLPYQLVELKVGDSLRIESSLVTQPGNFKLPFTLEITRLDDQPIDTPAGRFDDCRCFQSVTNSVIDVKIAKIPIRERRQWWYSDRVGATVKESYTRDPIKFLAISKEGYTSTSTLAAFGVRSLSPEQRAAAIRNSGLPAAPVTDNTTGSKWKWIPAAFAGCIVAFVVLRRIRRNRNRRPQMSNAIAPNRESD